MGQWCRVGVRPAAATVRTVNTNESVTADGGAGSTTEIEGDAGSLNPPVPDPPEEFRGFNTELRYEFLACNLRIQQARATGDREAERRARADREAVATKFVAKNARLAQSAAAPLMIKDRDLAQEHLQAAMLGLWEAFVGRDPDTIDGVIVEADGTLHPTGGWDPSKGTFSTWAGTFIAGRARRSVRSSEGAFTGMSYHTWGQKPKVDQARRELTSETGTTPSIAQIAARAGVTEDTVRACSKAAPASLDALVSGDGSTSLGDLVDEADAGLWSVEDQAAEHTQATFVRKVAPLATVDVLVMLLRTGLAGTPPRSVVQTADKLGIGRGSVGPAMARIDAALAVK